MFNVFPPYAKDFYKTDHRRQYPKGTTRVYSNFTARSDRLASIIKSVYRGQVVNFGIQAIVQKFFIETWNSEFFHKPKEEVIRRYKRRMDTALGPNDIGTEHFAALHDLGYLPLRIKALPEGAHVNMKVPLFTITNTHDDFYWLVNMSETIMSALYWKFITSATTAMMYRRLLDDYAEKTGTAKEFVQWQGHDFSFRGMSGFDDAVMSSSAHLLFFTGTDTIPAIDFLEEYYGADAEKELIGGSVPATEHSVMCLGGLETEIETFRRLIEDIYPSGIVSIVSDTWDYWKVIAEYAVELKDKIMARDGKVVFRPDSGDPVEIICGIEMKTADDFDDAVEQLCERVGDETPHGECGECDPSGIFLIDGKTYNITATIEWNRHDKQFYFIEESYLESAKEIELTPEQKGSIQCLWEIFGGTVTSTGHQLLDSHVGLIYGDSITLKRAEEILRRLEAKGFASGNVVFGIGSYTYEYVTRDTFGCAMKATAGVVNGQLLEVSKDPKTDKGTKKSAKGLLRVEKEGNDYVLYDQQTPEQEELGELKVVFEDGVAFNLQTLSTIRERALNANVH